MTTAKGNRIPAFEKRGEGKRLLPGAVFRASNELKQTLENVGLRHHKRLERDPVENIRTVKQFDSNRIYMKECSALG